MQTIVNAPSSSDDEGPGEAPVGRTHVKRQYKDLSDDESSDESEDLSDSSSSEGEVGSTTLLCGHCARSIHASIPLH
jgi:hypothetical protein